MPQTDSQSFKTIGLFGKPGDADAAETLHTLYQYLLAEGYAVVVEEATSQALAHHSSVKKLALCKKADLGKLSDLAIVVGGDGSMLNAARSLAHYHVPVLGVNRGHFGFLTDIRPTEVPGKIADILAGKFLSEERFLLRATIQRSEQPDYACQALNDIVLYPGDIARMIEFEVYIDGDFVYSQRSDGLIVSTPTGSTAYALSGGGPILHPSLDALVLVPKFPHTLSSRPIVIHGDSEVKIVIAESNSSQLHLSCDGQQHTMVEPGDEIIINKLPDKLWLIHPEDYDYYHVLRNKLGWGSKL